MDNLKTERKAWLKKRLAFFLNECFVCEELGLDSEFNEAFASAIEISAELDRLG